MKVEFIQKAIICTVTVTVYIYCLVPISMNQTLCRIKTILDLVSLYVGSVTQTNTLSIHLGKW